MIDPKEDSRYFGENVWIYCDQHMRPHMTGWCTVSNRNKTLLKATEQVGAYKECLERGFELYDDFVKTLDK
jgi:hypothetical protein